LHSDLVADDAMIESGTQREAIEFLRARGELSKVLIEGGQWRVFGPGGCRYQPVHEMSVRISISVQGVEMNPDRSSLMTMSVVR
jgi:hypothetical protein